jgi:hypothetical protein
MIKFKRNNIKTEKISTRYIISKEKGILNFDGSPMKYRIGVEKNEETGKISIFTNTSFVNCNFVFLKSNPEDIKNVLELLTEAVKLVD